MTDVHFQGPEPIELAGLCLICVMICKAAEMECHPEWQRLAEDGKPGQKWFPWEPHAKTLPLMRPAVTDGVSDVMPQLGRVPVCWDHLATITVTRLPRVAPANGPLPPGLLKGKG